MRAPGRSFFPSSELVFLLSFVSNPAEIRIEETGAEVDRVPPLGKVRDREGAHGKLCGELIRLDGIRNIRFSGICVGIR